MQFRVLCTVAKNVLCTVLVYCWYGPIYSEVQVCHTILVFLLMIQLHFHNLTEEHTESERPWPPD